MMRQETRAVIHVEHLRDQVYGLIREDLLSGDFSSGKRLPELALAERYRVSRTPVREALAQLHRDGLVAFTSQGYAVPNFSPKDVAQCLEVKQLMLPHFVETVTEHASKAQVDALHALAEEAQRLAERASMPERLLICINAFHDRLRALCANDLLQRSMFLADSRLGMIISTLAPSAQNQKAAADHVSAIANALAQRDRSALKAACLSQLEFCGALIRRAQPMEAMAA